MDEPPQLVIGEEPREVFKRARFPTRLGMPTMFGSGNTQLAVIKKDSSSETESSSQEEEEDEKKKKKEDEHGASLEDRLQAPREQLGRGSTYRRDRAASKRSMPTMFGDSSKSSMSAPANSRRPVQRKSQRKPQVPSSPRGSGSRVSVLSPGGKQVALPSSGTIGKVSLPRASRGIATISPRLEIEASDDDVAIEMEEQMGGILEPRSQAHHGRHQYAGRQRGYAIKDPTLLLEADTEQVLILNAAGYSAKDLYSWVVNLGWLPNMALFVALYWLFAVIWAAIYLIEDNCVLNSSNRTFSDLVYFSLQTQTTIGYGYFAPSPGCVWTNVVVGFQSIFAVIIIALVTGIIFNKFTLSSARISFSEQLLLRQNGDRKWLMFRLANKRLNGTYRNECRLIYTQNQKSGDMIHRRGYNLELVHNTLEFMSMGWALFHEIDEDSILYGMTEEQLIEVRGVFLCTFNAVDTRQDKRIWTKHIWTAADVAWGGAFAPLRITSGADGVTVFDMDKLSQIDGDPNPAFRGDENV